MTWSARQRRGQVSEPFTEEQRVKAALEHAVALARNTTPQNMTDEACVDWALRRYRQDPSTEGTPE